MPDKPHFPTEEENVLKYWQSIDAFHRQLELSEGKPEFTFYDGPPFATGLPHYGHIAAGTIKVSTTRPGHSISTPHSQVLFCRRAHTISIIN